MSKPGTASVGAKATTSIPGKSVVDMDFDPIDIAITARKKAGNL
jgi:hypothetical protein